MSIDIFIKQTDMQPLEMKEGFYWYLHPMFEQINTHTGRYIDLYGKCSFPVESLAILQRYIFDKKQVIRQIKPATITFISGTIITKSKAGKISKKDNVLEINKNELLELLNQINHLIDIARQNSLELCFAGD